MLARPEEFLFECWPTIMLRMDYGIRKVLYGSTVPSPTSSYQKLFLVFYYDKSKGFQFHSFSSINWGWESLQHIQDTYLYFYPSFVHLYYKPNSCCLGWACFGAKYTMKWNTYYNHIKLCSWIFHVWNVMNFQHISTQHLSFDSMELSNFDSEKITTAGNLIPINRDHSTIECFLN